MKIISRWTETVLWEDQSPTVKESLTASVSKKTYLQGADLRGAYLQGADLRGAYLQGADLQGADLRGADLQGADLRGAYLQGADLQGADLQGAYLRGADLQGADLQGAHLNWDSHDLLAEVLRQHAGLIVPRRMVAGLLLVSRDWCWKNFFALDHPERPWALQTLIGYATEQSPAPALLVAAMAALPATAAEGGAE